MAPSGKVMPSARVSIVVRTVRFHRTDRGSIPRPEVVFPGRQDFFFGEEGHFFVLFVFLASVGRKVVEKAVLFCSVVSCRAFGLRTVFSPPFFFRVSHFFSLLFFRAREDSAPMRGATKKQFFLTETKSLHWGSNPGPQTY